VILQIAALGAPEHHGALAQLAPPSGHPTGILGVQDHRVQLSPETWPWSSIGRINVVGISSRGWCTGTLIAPRRVLTAAHCLFNTRTNDWVKPGSLHFVVGQAKDRFLGHSPVESFSTSPEFKFKLEDRPRYDFIAHNMIRHDWAIVTLQEALPLPAGVARSLSQDTPLTTNMSSRCMRAATLGSMRPNRALSLICATPRRENPEPPFCFCVTVARC
jgi:hypothetical protein